MQSWIICDVNAIKLRNLSVLRMFWFLFFCMSHSIFFFCFVFYIYIYIYQLPLTSLTGAVNEETSRTFLPVQHLMSHLHLDPTLNFIYCSSVTMVMGGRAGAKLHSVLRQGMFSPLLHHPSPWWWGERARWHTASQCCPPEEVWSNSSLTGSVLVCVQGSLQTCRADSFNIKPDLRIYFVLHPSTPSPIIRELIIGNCAAASQQPLVSWHPSFVTMATKTRPQSCLTWCNHGETVLYA